MVQPVYAPALVAFVGGADFGVSVSFGGLAGIGWFPLAPREVYVPPYQYSPRYIRNVNVTNVNYRNRRVPDAVTAVSHDVFVSARPVATAAVVVSPRAATTAQVFGMTAPLAPRRESVFARAAISGDSRRVTRPPDQVLARPVVGRVAPPPAPVPFDVRQKAMETQPGRPLDPRAMETLRGQGPSKAALVPAVRPAAPVRDTLKPAREGLPAPKPVAVQGFAPAPRPGAVSREATSGQPAAPTPVPRPGVSREAAPAPPGKPRPEAPAKALKPGEVSGEEEAAPEPADKPQPEGSGKGKPR